ncbi:MAG: 16S rRNA (cytosine(1402)-N(4))-methyltransferase RsmH [Candidatus Nanopelagicaceae bacterium]|jgi:16S rRNA (cytosine1402-N4)-methyltransferase
MMKAGEKIHKSVMLDRCIALLAPSIEKSANPIVIDATLGMGGHAEALLERYPNLLVVGIDRDTEAIKIASNRLAKFGARFTFVHAVFDQMPEVLSELGIKGVDGILFDLGVSSLQLDHVDRGFSYSNSAPLDMRMDKSSGLTARDVLENYSKEDLVKILRTYGEERFATRIVENIIKARSAGTLKTTTDLAELVKASIPAPARRVGGNPAKRTFQAIRIEVNQELKILENALPKALNQLKVGGRLVVMSFQSLEDKIVKQAFASASESKNPIGLPVELEHLKAKYQLVFRGSEGARAEEIETNSRAQSVRLRAIERVAS